MDTALLDGDFDKDGRGLPYPIADERELLQRALIRLTVQRGSFCCDKTFGSRLFALRGVPAAQLEGQALLLVREALREMPGVTVRAVHVLPGDGRLRLKVQLALGGRQEQLEVAV
jgi:hypothetical protein